jgi:hypothetical protein
MIKDFAILIFGLGMIATLATKTKIPKQNTGTPILFV